MPDLICQNCGGPRDLGRRKCTACFAEHHRQQAKLRYAKNGGYKYALVCTACKASYKGWRKRSVLCPTCYKFRVKLAGVSVASNNYEPAGGDGYCWRHRRIAEAVLGRKLLCHEVVHHIDGNPRNNELTNLMVLTRSMHGKLHNYLDTQRVILVKTLNDNFENCWNTLIAPMTTAWLETAGAKVIKLWEIGQPAAELDRDKKSTQEGSETMHETPVTDFDVGDDIVQTTTETTSES